MYLADDGDKEDVFSGSLILSSNVIYILKDGDDYTVVKAKDLDKLDVKFDSSDDRDEYDADNASTLVKVLTYEEEDDAPEVVAIIFEDAE